MKRHLWLVLMATAVAVLGCSEEGEEPADVGTGGPTCTAPQEDCSGTCVTTKSDMMNCGACGTDCAAQGFVGCTVGYCVACPSGQFECNGACIDVLGDANNCGNCNQVCDAGQQCVEGVCGGVATQPPAVGAGEDSPDAMNPPTGISCTVPQEACGLQCVDTTSSNAHCGGCGQTCGNGSSCQDGGCVCSPGTTACAAADGTFPCVNLQADGSNCGACGTTCPAGSVCSAGDCAAGGCPQGALLCGGGCVDQDTDVNNCGACEVQCVAGQTCELGGCKCEGGNSFKECGGVCTDTDTDSANCGMCGTACPIGQVCAAGTCGAPGAMEPPAPPVGMGGAGNMPLPPAGGGAPPAGGAGSVPMGRTCPVQDNVIADFEEGTGALPEVQGRKGALEAYDNGAGMRTDAVEMEGAEDCNKYVYHAQGAGFGTAASGYSGIGTAFTAEEVLKDGKMEWAPTGTYDAEALGYKGISFRAKAGPGQSSPVRFSLATEWTEGGDYGDGSCSDAADADHPCWNHLGHFLMDDEALSAEWQDFTFCFDRDMHPMWLPSGVVTGRRKALGKNLLKIQFQFNQAMDPATFDTDEYMNYSHAGSFDFYVDDIRFVSEGCGEEIFQSSAGTTDAFGTNAAVGACEPVPNAAAYNEQISEAYVRWKRDFVQGGRVIDPQEDGRVVSEGVGYGMLMTAAMGDKETFDAIWGWAKPLAANTQNGLLGWKNGADGSAADADTDIAYALLMADKQWGGGSYEADGLAMAAAAKTHDVDGNVIRGGEGFRDPLNPSYFSPGFYRAFPGWEAVITESAKAVASCQTHWDGLLPDWCGGSGTSWSPAVSTGQQNANELCLAGQPCMAMDAARIAWRLGFDACLGGDNDILSKYLAAIKAKGSIDQGARVDLLKTGWGQMGPITDAVAFTIAFIGPVGVGAMGLGDPVTFERAFMTVMDVIERPEYNQTYYQTTVGLLSLLMMSGNWPAL